MQQADKDQTTVSVFSHKLPCLMFYIGQITTNIGSGADGTIKRITRDLSQFQRFKQSFDIHNSVR